MTPPAIKMMMIPPTQRARRRFRASHALRLALGAAVSSLAAPPWDVLHQFTEVSAQITVLPRQAAASDEDSGLDTLLESGLAGSSSSSSSFPTTNVEASLQDDGTNSNNSSSNNNSSSLHSPSPSPSPSSLALWRILHITDAHISLSEAPDLHPGTRRMHGAFRNMEDKWLHKGEKRLPQATFRKLLALVEDLKPDVLVLGGDIVNYPQNSSVQFVLDSLRAAGIGGRRLPVLYTAGNHDWLVEGSPQARKEQWKEHRDGVLRPFYRLAGSCFGSNDRLCSKEKQALEVDASEHIGHSAPPRLLMLTLDTSTLEVDSEQAEFIWSQLSRGIPTVLTVHVPFMLRGVSPRKHKFVLCGDERYGFDGDTSWQVERRERWPRSGLPPATQKFVEDLLNHFAAPNGPLLAVLAGHEHTPRADVVGSTFRTPPCLEKQLNEQCLAMEVAGLRPDTDSHGGFVQYVSPAACDGGYRLVEVRMLR